MKEKEINEKEKLINEFRNTIKKIKFKFAWTYAKTYPHEYILNKNTYRFGDKKDIEKAIKIMRILIFKYGTTEIWNKKLWKIFFLDGYKYWFDYFVLNRKWLKGYAIDFDKKTYKKII